MGKKITKCGVCSRPEAVIASPALFSGAQCCHCESRVLCGTKQSPANVQLTSFSALVPSRVRCFSPGDCFATSFYETLTFFHEG